MIRQPVHLFNKVNLWEFIKLINFIRKPYLWSMSCGIYLLCNHINVMALDVIQPYLSSSITHDSNLFRFSLDVGSGEASETINRTEAGIKVRYPVSRQNFNLDLSVNHTQFQRYEFLNYTGSNGQAVWNWQVGNLWQGDLGYTRSQTLINFAVTQATVQDIRIQQSAFVSANYMLHPDWRLRWGGKWYEMESGLSSSQFLNSKELSTVVGVDYISNANNSVGVESQFIEARFPEFQITPGSSFDNGYSQVMINSVANWQYSGDSRFGGRLGYTQRQYNQLATRDFKGMTGRLTYDWAITGKTLLAVAVWGEVGAVADVISTFAVNKGSSMSISWSPTSKIFMRSDLTRQTQDFRGDSGFVLGVSDPRKDDILTFGATVGYNPIRNIQLLLQGIIEQRDSTRRLVDYNYKLITATIKIDF